jgi:hypothetical protein
MLESLVFAVQKEKTRCCHAGKLSIGSSERKKLDAGKLCIGRQFRKKKLDAATLRSFVLAVRKENN